MASASKSIPEAIDPHSPADSSALSSAASLKAPEIPEIPVSPNPWDDAKAASETGASDTKPPAATLNTIDPAIYDQPIFAGLKEEIPITPPPKEEVRKDVLDEFDPLVASPEEKAARDAWESSEGHPPPPRTPSPPTPPVKDSTASTPAPTEDTTPNALSPSQSAVPIASPSSFPSLAAFARSFSIPLVRPRPVSLDATVKAVPSPATAASFAAQQDASRGDSSKRPTSGTSTPNRTGSGPSSPKPNDGGFDFQRFLDQMKTRSAEPVSKYLRSFLSNFAKRTFTVNDQVKIINDFLTFIAGQMRDCEVWKNASDTEFENAMEGMEKLVMNRLYDFTFTPQLAEAVPPRPITTDDLERDRVLSQRIALFGWIEEKHLDVPEGEGSKGFLMFAQQELLKINHYKAPRDKLICILNCCKVIFGLIRHLNKEEGADSFVPILIFVVLKANPEHLLSNVEFINRFRNPEKLQSEAGYYLSSLMGAVSFIETMDHTSLSSITREEFEKNVEEAIQALPPSEPQSPATTYVETKGKAVGPSSPHAGEESAQPLAIATPSQTLSEDARRLLQKTGDTISKPLNAIGRIFSEALDGAENKLSYLPGPFAPFELGRENRNEHPSAPHQGSGAGPSWGDQEGWQGGQTTPRSANTPQTPYGPQDVPYGAPIQTPYKPRVKRGGSPSFFPTSPGNSPGFMPEETPSRPGPYTHQPLAMGPSQPMYSQHHNQLLPPRVQSLASEGAHISRTPTPALDIAGVQAQIDSAHEQAAAAARDTLLQIFPSVEVGVVELVLEANAGDLGKSIESLLEMSGES
ncbi:hypothetical protein CVT24_003562 [Panaeolus cyanescens]|uniref:VPS9 domain-containing protein n=1 Tax=Panaeolus cyanescens TaxID=181874 RepID=A0A409Y786_9AGAR|nr:hypothetical protein CVT24_003562 [Panaeolus cyanescens]